MSEHAPTITPEALKQLIHARESIVIVDVRAATELVNGAIRGSMLLPLPELEDAMSLSPTMFFTKYGFVLPKDERIIVVCRSGTRSERAVRYLRPLGYDAHNLTGGMNGWSAFDRSITKY